MGKVEFLNKVKSSIHSVDPNAKIILFGSRARGDETQESDWDFLILTRKNADEKLKQTFRDKIFYTELETEQPISTIIYTHSQWEQLKITGFYQNVNQDGVEV